MEARLDVQAAARVGARRAGHPACGCPSAPAHAHEVRREADAHVGARRVAQALTEEGGRGRGIYFQPTRAQHAHSPVHSLMPARPPCRAPKPADTRPLTPPSTHLLDLWHVAVAGHAVRVDALGDLDVQVGLLGGAAGARHAWWVRCGREGGGRVSSTTEKARMARAWRSPRGPGPRPPAAAQGPAAPAPLLASMMMSSFEISPSASSGASGSCTDVG
jgi:hypothetical protein